MASFSNVSNFSLFVLTALLTVLFASGAEKQKDVEYKDITFIVLSQPNSFHAKRAQLLKEDFEKQVKQLNLKGDDRPGLYLLHETEGLPSLGVWTLFPVFSVFPDVFPSTPWVFFCEEETRIKLPKLLNLLKRFDSSKDVFLGRGLHDAQISIIHHFYGSDDPEAFAMPDVRAGFLLSQPLVTRLAEMMKDLPGADLNSIDFNIDPKHEFARYLLEKLGTSLTELTELCVLDSEDCATYDNLRFPQCGAAIPDEDFTVAVKTCGKFHADRVPVVKKTWGQESSNIEYFSDVDDSSIPTITLGVPNTERGHCGKTMAIIRRAAERKEFAGKKWLLIADDDTIISLQKLRLILACYDAREEIALGERYGYMSARGYGYDYITGGGGMLFSWPLLKQLAKECTCPADDSPDDMILGMCLKRMDITITHSPYIHQARMEDYSADFLKHRSHVSFHKHWDSNPVKTYELLQRDVTSKHDEL
ncbi:beta-1,3-glucosyltransferase-like [Haliotis rubra]|uniref:beta-1,3-glucosyltransferase-like n=1 Tax=Haliotis rubra TaxID=36100 RepID=UPI001EE53EE7|nr:beta-1,3-glucosyltransferase-like [Haliotis rubra]XP_046543286.1 beta-1,3-glucosyltransferase-like [Haliotis rubra]XP_046543287.1 beta-1,3-glucosyltransferase-like [Haliotis rubra]XP_046543288.1 beta-1,3-glucosyltransferase-like [Haliotis rubra]XP_046543289.1 beta-1,3-glucosyltransferase-like [Haliotis rubra]